ncbi:MAG: hypothetical protein RI912_1082 [Actinomycetota bacterium]
MRQNTAIALLAASLVALGACSNGAQGTGTSGNDTTPATVTDANPKEVTLLAYDAFTPAEGIFDDFEKQTGAKVKVVTGGDSGTVISKAILTSGNPEGDVLWGVDNTTIARAKAANLLESYEPVDTGDVCVNYSKSWYAKGNLAPPKSFDDLIKPEYANQLVIEDPVNSSPGLAFLLATIKKYGEGAWQSYWYKLAPNGVRIVADWTTAWTVEYAGGGNPGTYPLVVSYASSPPAEIVYAADPKNPPSEPDSGVITDTCFRQTEYAGVLRGAKNPNNARKLIDYLLGRTFQESMPLSLFVFPVNSDAKLPDVFTKWATRPADPLTAEPTQAQITRWLDEWRAIAL